MKNFSFLDRERLLQARFPSSIWTSSSKMNPFKILFTLLVICTFPPLLVEGHCGVDSEQLTRPFKESLKFPFTKDESVKCGHWGANSQDYPYFGAPRNNDHRHHAGVDLYPLSGTGTEVRAMKDGTVVKIGTFYVREDGEISYGIVIDHGDFVANYAELKKPRFAVGARLKKGDPISEISGTEQLHLEFCQPGTRNWMTWHDVKPESLIDPTETLLKVFKMGVDGARAVGPGADK